MQRILRGLAFPLFVALLWEATSRTGLLTFEFLSRPSDILRAGMAGKSVV